jgi:hypothetical protein
MLFLNTWRVSAVPYYATTHRPAAIQKQHWHSREAQIEPPLIECEWAFRIWAKVSARDPLESLWLGVRLSHVLCNSTLSSQLKVRVISTPHPNTYTLNFVPRLFFNAPQGKTLVQAGHMSPIFLEITKMLQRGGGGGGLSLFYWSSCQSRCPCQFGKVQSGCNLTKCM